MAMTNIKFWPELLMIAVNLLYKCKIKLCREECSECDFLVDGKCQFIGLFARVDEANHKYHTTRLEAVLAKYAIAPSELARSINAAPSTISFCLRYGIRSQRSAERYAEGINRITGEEIDWRELMGYL